MFAKLTYPIRKLFYSSLMLGIAFVMLGGSFPASANTDAQHSLAPVTVVPNDDFDNPLIVNTIPYNNTQDVIDATTAADDPGFTCYYGGQKYNTVWYRFIPSISEALIFSTDGSSYGPLLAIWTGARGSLVSQACSSSSQVEFAVVAGTTYYIEIARSADDIIPAPTKINVVFSIWSADTPPDAFGKSTPVNGAANQSSNPKLIWEESSYAANYAYCYDTSNNGLCDTSWITTTGTTASLSGLSLNTAYYWQVRAANTADVIDADGGEWWSFTTVNPADLNHWAGTVSSTGKPVSFDVLDDGSLWLKFSVSVPYNGCNKSGYSTITIGGPGAITNRNFSYGNQSNSFSFSGTFNAATSATGSYRLNNYPVCVWITPPGYCCYAFTSGSGTWTASGPALPTTEQKLYLPLILR
jgi:hypothetical protein